VNGWKTCILHNIKSKNGWIPPPEILMEIPTSKTTIQLKVVRVVKNYYEMQKIVYLR